MPYINGRYVTYAELEQRDRARRDDLDIYQSYINGRNTVTRGQAVEAGRRLGIFPDEDGRRRR